MNHLISSNLAGVWHLWSDRHQRLNNIPHGPWSWCLHRFNHQFGWSRSQANNEDLLFQIRQSRSIHCSLSNFRTPCAMVMTSLDYCNRLLGGKPCKVSHQSVIWRVRKGTVPHWLNISAKNAFKICELAHPCLRGLLHPIWYLTPVSDIPGRTFAYFRSAAMGMLKYPGLDHRLWQSDHGNFAISSSSAWNFLQVDLHDPGFSLTTLRWKLKAILFSSSAYLSVHQMLYIVFMFVNSRRLLFDTICNSFLIIIIITITTILLLNK